MKRAIKLNPRHRFKNLKDLLSDKENWTDREKNKFEELLQLYGPDWKRISICIKTKTKR